MTSQIDSITYIRFEISNCTADVDLPGAPLTYFNDGGGPKDFFGSDILAKRDFFGSRKQLTQGFFWVLYFSSAQINNNISAIYSFVFDQNQN